MVHMGESPHGGTDAGHGTGEVGNDLPVPAPLKSIFLSYPKAFLCTTFLYCEPKYAFRNLLFFLQSIGKGLSVSFLIFLPAIVVNWLGLCQASNNDVSTDATRTSQTMHLLLAYAFASHIAIVIFRYLEFRKFSHIPGPEPSFLWGNFWDLCADGWGNRHYTLIDMHKKYGPVVRLHMPLFKRPFVYCNFIPDVIHDKNLDALRPTKTLIPGSLMGIPLGPRHAKNRHHLSMIKSNRNFQVMLQNIDVISSDLSDSMVQNARRNGQGGGLNKLLLEWALDAMFLYLYGTHPKTSKEKQEIIAAVDMFTGEVSRRTNEPIWMWFMSWGRVKEWTTGFAALLSLANRYYEDPNAPLPQFMKNHGLRKWEAMDELTTFLAASFESTAHTVAQCIVMLSKDNERQEKASKEAQDVLKAAGGGPILQEQIHNCTYLKHCVYEALRLHATIPFSARKMKRDYHVQTGGKTIKVPGKSYLVYFKTAVGLNEDIFENAASFEPERYSSTDSRAQKHSKFLPFGTGPRQCWGQIIAELQMIQVLVHLLARLEFQSGADNTRTVAAVSVAAPGVDSVRYFVRN